MKTSKRLTRRLAIGAGLLCLTPLLTSCAKAPDCPPFSAPPAIRLQDVPEPVFRGSTNDDLIRYIQDLRGALRQSNLDKAALRHLYLGDAPADQ
jgi:hypothetical protein